MAITPTQAGSRRTLALIEANAAIANKTPAQIALIVAKAKQEMTTPGGATTPPPP